MEGQCVRRRLQSAGQHARLDRVRAVAGPMNRAQRPIRNKLLVGPRAGCAAPTGFERGRQPERARGLRPGACREVLIKLTPVSQAYRSVGVARSRSPPPSTVGVIQATEFELVINLQTARLLDIEVPLTLLARADEVIE